MNPTVYSLFKTRELQSARVWPDGLLYQHGGLEIFRDTVKINARHGSVRIRFSDVAEVKEEATENAGCSGRLFGKKKHQLILKTHGGGTCVLMPRSRDYGLVLSHIRQCMAAQSMPAEQLMPPYSVDDQQALATVPEEDSRSPDTLYAHLLR